MGGQLALRGTHRSAVLGGTRSPKTSCLGGLLVYRTTRPGARDNFMGGHPVLRQRYELVIVRFLGLLFLDFPTHIN